jgi:hypothetical protein
VFGDLRGGLQEDRPDTRHTYMIGVALTAVFPLAGGGAR